MSPRKTAPYQTLDSSASATSPTNRRRNNEGGGMQAWADFQALRHASVTSRKWVVGHVHVRRIRAIPANRKNGKMPNTPESAAP